MLTADVDADRLSRSRFALSRLAELTCGLEVLAHPSRAPYAQDWVNSTRRTVRLDQIAVLFALVEHGSWYVPDFLVPVPRSYEPSLEDELAAVAQAPPNLVRQQLELTFRIGPVPRAVQRRGGGAPGTDPRAPLPAVVAEVLADGERALTSCVAEQLGLCWDSVLAEMWPGLRRVLEADVHHRATEAVRLGFGRLIGGLHPKLNWDGHQVTLELGCEVNADVGPGLVLTPSVFLPRPAVWLGEPGQLLIGYPARGRGRVWARPTAARRDRNLLGPRRAALLTDLDTPRSTSELAARHQLSPATVSYHLGRLRSAGLVVRRQSGHSVLYERTARGALLLS